MNLGSYQAFGDIDSEDPPTKAQLREQRAAVEIARAVKRMHFHEMIDSEGVEHLISHVHDNDALGHVHEDERGRYLPSMAKHPGFSEATLRRLEAIAALPRGPQVEWTLRLFCGHIVRRTVSADYSDIRRAGVRGPCEECGLNPATIIAARPERLIPRERSTSRQSRPSIGERASGEPPSSELIPPKGDGVPPGWHRV